MVASARGTSLACLRLCSTPAHFFPFLFLVVALGPQKTIARVLLCWVWPLSAVWDDCVCSRRRTMPLVPSCVPLGVAWVGMGRQHVPRSCSPTLSLCAPLAPGPPGTWAPVHAIRVASARTPFLNFQAAPLPPMLYAGWPVGSERCNAVRGCYVCGERLCVCALMCAPCAPCAQSVIRGISVGGAGGRVWAGRSAGHSWEV
mmetsp:Transcript_64052/g.191185  ORF Transcript_64052/g.191185 Transcript_64052/m.191185 type:complete len:201 (+) Transcript_64052:3341-3943(+)